MRVLIETTPVERRGHDRGLGRYTRAALEAASSSGFAVIPLAVRRRAGRTAEFRDLLERQARVYREDHEVFHATTSHVSVIRSPTRYVVTILDVIPLDHSGYRQTGIKGRMFFSLASRADCVLTLSEFSAERIATRLGVPENRIIIAPLPPAPAFHHRAASAVSAFTAEHGIGGPYVSGLADLRTPDPRKRSGWLLEIGARLDAHGVRLVAAGAGTEAWSKRRGVLGLGRISDDELATLHSGSLCHVGTSSYEGQGMPALEAMACGSPVVAMSNSSIPEIVGDGGCLISEQGELLGRSNDDAIGQIVEACIAIERDDTLRSRLSLRALRAAGEFTEDRFANGLQQAYCGARSG